MPEKKIIHDDSPVAPPAQRSNRSTAVVLHCDDLARLACLRAAATARHREARLNHAHHAARRRRSEEACVGANIQH